MNATQRIQLCNRMVARLEDVSATRYELIDIATVLVFVQRDLTRMIDARSEPGPNSDTVDELTASLRWIRRQGQEASLADLRTHVGVAVQAAIAGIRQLGIDASPIYSHVSNQPSQERLYD